MNSRNITFQTGAFRGWTLAVTAINDGDDWAARIFAQLETPRLANGRRRDGLLAFRPDTPGYAEMLAALDGFGVAPLEDALVWIVEATREARDNDSDIAPEQRAYWQPIVDAADHARAEFFARYPDGLVPAFEVVGALSVAVPA